MGMKARDMTPQWWDERKKLLDKVITNNEKRENNHGYRIMGDGSIRVCWLDPTKGWKHTRVLSQTQWNWSNV